MKGGVTDIATSTSGGTSATKDTAVRIKKFYVAHFRHKHRLLRVNEIDYYEILLHYISDDLVLFLVQSF